MNVRADVIRHVDPAQCSRKGQRVVHRSHDDVVDPDRSQSGFMRGASDKAAPRVTSALITALPVLPPAPVTRIMFVIRKAAPYCRHCERSEAIQTFFLALACFAEPVIGRAFARPVGSP